MGKWTEATATRIAYVAVLVCKRLGGMEKHTKKSRLTVIFSLTVKHHGFKYVSFVRIICLEAVGLDMIQSLIAILYTLPHSTM